MKKILSSALLMLPVLSLLAQSYPDPEFSNEISLLKKDSTWSLTRLEKGNSKMEAKNKLAGFGGSETSYSMDGGKSPVRITSQSNLSFVFTTNVTPVNSNSKADSVMKSGGVDPSMMQGLNSFSDPGNNIVLYKVETSPDQRKILLMKTGGALPFSNHKVKSSDKYTFSLKKISPGYWVLVTDKTLPKGEYAFTLMNMLSGSGAMGGVLLFAFGVD